MNKFDLTRVVAKPGNDPIEIKVSAFGVRLTEDLRTAVTRKIGRVCRYAPDAMRAVVDLEKTSPHGSPEQFRVFVRYELPGYDVTAEHRAHEPLTAIDIVAEKIERRLRKRKTALLASRFGRHGRSVRIADFCIPPPLITNSPALEGAAL
jgi:ribosomal subunit interface protein